MESPIFTVAVRNTAGEASLFHVAHESVQTLEQAREAVSQAIPDARVILVGIG